jgi:hypothetical protein
MALNTIDQVNAAIREIVDGDHPRAMKPTEVKLRAARLADLYEVRLSLWRELGQAAELHDVIPDAYRMACSVAIKHDGDQVRYWRGQAR